MGMKVYRVFYNFAGTQTSLVMRGFQASQALMAAELMLQPGARVCGIEEVR